MHKSSDVVHMNPFLLILEDLSLLIKKAKKDGLLKGIVLSLAIALTHLLFVDDIVLFGHGSLA